MILRRVALFPWHLHFLPRHRIMVFRFNLPIKQKRTILPGCSGWLAIMPTLTPRQTRNFLLTLNTRHKWPFFSQAIRLFDLSFLCVWTPKTLLAVWMTGGREMGTRGLALQVIRKSGFACVVWTLTCYKLDFSFCFWYHFLGPYFFIATCFLFEVHA